MSSFPADLPPNEAHRAPRSEMSPSQPAASKAAEDLQILTLIGVAFVTNRHTPMRKTKETTMTERNEEGKVDRIRLSTPVASMPSAIGSSDKLEKRLSDFRPKERSSVVGISDNKLHVAEVKFPVRTV
eukprot:874893-Amphidinium_carterae.2